MIDASAGCLERPTVLRLHCRPPLLLLALRHVPAQTAKALSADLQLGDGDGEAQRPRDGPVVAGQAEKDTRYECVTCSDGAANVQFAAC